MQTISVFCPRRCLAVGFFFFLFDISMKYFTFIILKFGNIVSLEYGKEQWEEKSIPCSRRLSFLDGNGRKQCKLAEQFNISKSVVCRILKRKSLNGCVVVKSPSRPHLTSHVTVRNILRASCQIHSGIPATFLGKSRALEIICLLFGLRCRLESAGLIRDRPVKATDFQEQGGTGRLGMHSSSLDSKGVGWTCYGRT